MTTSHTARLADGNMRVTALDGLRGLLALVVVAWHVAAPFQQNWLLIFANLSVYAFFLLSGYALTRAWDGNMLTFVVRRLIRLWPVYAVCLAGAYLLTGYPVVWSRFFWFPFVRAETLPAVNPPIWSLFIEVWTIPLMPLIAWAASSRLLRCAGVILVFVVLGWVIPEASVVPLFIAGAYFSGQTFRNRFLESWLPQWLGKISYSLYLSHWLVLYAAAKLWGPWGPLLSLPLVFVVAWLVWYVVERPSIHLSRRAGKWLQTVFANRKTGNTLEKQSLLP